MLKLMSAMPSLTTTLKADSGVCALSGIVLLLASQPIAALIAPNAPALFGLTLPNLLEILGFGLITVAIAVYLVASRRSINHTAVWLIIGLEAVWIVDSVILLFWANDVLTLLGKELIIDGAIAVLIFMLLEIRGLNTLRRSQAS